MSSRRMDLKMVGQVMVALMVVWSAGSTGSTGSTGVNAPWMASAQESCPSVMGMTSWCQPMVRCSAFWAELSKSSDPICYGRTLSDGSTRRGVCCPVVTGVHNVMGLIRETNLEDELAHVNPQEQTKVMQNRRLLDRLAASEMSSEEHSPFISTESSVTETARLAQLGLIVTKATQELQQSLRLSKEAGGIATQMVSVKGTPVSEACAAAPVCRRNSKYRTLDGSCNNLRRPLLGRANTGLGRLLPARYEDGVHQMKSQGLPQVRKLRHIMAADTEDHMDDRVTAMLMQFGQFISHDLTFVGPYTLSNGSRISCCTKDGQHLEQHKRHPQCMPLDIAQDDPFYSRYNVRCVSAVRSMVAPRSQCNFGYAQQLNRVTGWLDASQVYGSNEESSDKLRLWQSGRLRTMNSGGRDLLPVDDENRECPGYDKGLRCFVTGDSRSNMLITLTALHTIFVRHHNHLAEGLSHINPFWDDERLFQEARRILIAQMQHITYNEYLPVVLGMETMEKYGLLPRTSGYFQDHTDDLESLTLAAFSGAANRYGHSLVTHAMDLVAEDGTCYYRMNLKDWFRNSHALRQPGILDGALRGMVYHNSMVVDKYFSSDLTQFLFRERELPYGQDLISLNIHRGRDMGLNDYNSYRELFGLPKAWSFEQMSDVLPRDVVDSMKTLYQHPDDVDLYIAGMSETVKPEGSLVGHTFSHIIAQQFARLKQADSYFYELGGQPSSFTPAQLDEIRKTSLASILCGNGDDILHMPSLTFVSISSMNQVVPCSHIPFMSLSPWME